jgi:hypothetical protein
MLKGITVAGLTMLLSSLGSTVFAQNHSYPLFSQNVPLNKPVKIEPVGQPASVIQPASTVPLMKPLPGQNSVTPTKSKPTSSVAKPYPAGTPCGVAVVNGQQVFVRPGAGSYCDRDGTLQYK